MKMLLTIASLFALAGMLSSCTESKASIAAAPTPENGAQFKEGQGLSLTETMAEAIDLKVAEVQEETIAPVFTAELQSVHRGKEASGWMSAEQAERVTLGMKADLKLAGAAETISGKVLRIERSAFAAGGDYEVVVESPSELDPGVSVAATFRLKADGNLTAIPKSALLSTAEGHFVYAKNGEYYVRTAVKIGAVGEEHVEILDGLYTGDEIVTSPVMSLWLAELQSLRGGKACNCGH